jgi:hypothetical protein
MAARASVSAELTAKLSLTPDEQKVGRPIIESGAPS